MILWKLCRRGHEMQPHNVKFEYISGKYYPKCRLCISVAVRRRYRMHVESQKLASNQRYHGGHYESP